MPTLLPFRSLMVRMRLVREQLVAAGMHARQRRDRLAGIQMATTEAAKSRPKSTSPRAIICAKAKPASAGT